MQFSAQTLADQPTRDAAAIATVKTQIASNQDAIIGSHFGSATNPTPGAGFPRGLLQFDITPMFAVNVSKAELDALAADRGGLSSILIWARPADAPSERAFDRHDDSLRGSALPGPAKRLPSSTRASSRTMNSLLARLSWKPAFPTPAAAAGAFSLCPNGQSFQSGTGAANPTTAGMHQQHDQSVYSRHTRRGNRSRPQHRSEHRRTHQRRGEERQNRRGPSFHPLQRYDQLRRQCAVPVLAFTSDQISALNWLVQNALAPAAGVSLPRRQI